MKKVLPILLCILFMLLTPMTALAASGEQDGLNVDVKTDKSSYGTDESVSVSAVLTNSNNYDVSDVKVELLTPNGLTLRSGQTPKTVNLAAKQSLTFPFTLASGFSIFPSTGDSTGGTILLAALILFASAGMLFLVRRRTQFPSGRGFHLLGLMKKPFFRVLSFLLCVSLLLPYISTFSFLKAKAADTDKTFTVSQTIDVGGVSHDIAIKVTYPAFTKSATVSFETNGGSTVEPVIVAKGGTMSNVPTPTKSGSTFVGWYNDQALTSPFYSDLPITADTTLYASYKAQDNNLKEYPDTEVYFEDCKPDISFSVISPVALTSQNLADYVQLTSYIGDIPDINITADNGVYTLTPATSYAAGGHYELKLLNDTLSFNGQQPTVRSIAFRIYKEQVENVKLKSGIKYMLWSDVTTVSDNVYSVSPDKYSINTGDVICLWNGKMDSASKMCDVQQATTVPGSNGAAASTLLYTEDSSPSDVFDQVDVSTTQMIPTSDYIKNVDTNSIAQAAKNSAGTKELTQTLYGALAKSQTLSYMADGSGGGFPEPVKENNDGTEISVEGLTEGLTVTASICTADNDNFMNQRPNEWVALTLNFNYDTVVKGKAEIKASFVVKEYIKTYLFGDINWNGGNIAFDLAQSSYTQTTTTLNVLIRSYSADDSEYTDITQEVESLTGDGGDSTNDADPASILQQTLAAKGDDVELVDVNLFKSELDIIPDFPIFQITGEVNFVVKMNFAAGISASTTVMYAKQTGFCGSAFGGMSSYSHDLTGNNRYSFDLYCGGYLGFKAGLEVSIGFSVCGLSDLGQVGISGEIGVYLDMYGFVHVNVVKRGMDDYVDSSIVGGLYMEVGVYGEVDLFAKSEVFRLKDETSLFQVKVPIFSLGNRYVLLRFDDNDNLLLHSESSAVSTTPGLLDADYLDITTGDTVTGSYGKLSDFYLVFSSPYITDDNDSIVVHKDQFGKFNYPQYLEGNNKRLDFKVYVYYEGSNLAKARTIDNDAVKVMNATWIDSSLNISDNSETQTVTATYVMDHDGTKTTLAQRQMLFGEVPGSIDMSSYYALAKVTCDKDVHQAITQDTVYTYSVQTYEKLVSFITYHDGTWHYDVYPVKIGDVPTLPDNYNSPGGQIKFKGWYGVPGENTREQITDQVAAVPPSVLVSGGYSDTYFGLDTTKPVYSQTGNYEDCIKAYSVATYQGTPLNSSSYALYYAFYSFPKFKVKFIVPSMNYSALGQTYSYPGETDTNQYTFDTPVNFSGVFGKLSRPGYTFMGWDTNGDGVADYTDESMPVATSDMTLTAVFKAITYHVTVLDKDGNLSQSLTVNSGNLPDILKTSPAYPGGSSIYRFKYWLVSINGGDFAPWTGQQPGVNADWTIKPCYGEYYSVTFDYGGGTCDGAASKTILVEAGTHKVSDMMNAAPTKSSTAYDTYTFNGWSCGDALTVSGDMTVTAQYTDSPVLYTATFHTDTGEFASGGTDVSYTGDYSSYQNCINTFLSKNTFGTMKPVYTDDTVYTFERWDCTEGTTSVNYVAVWQSTPREYTVTFNAGEGTFSGGATESQTDCTYNSTGDFSSVNSAEKTADKVTTYKLTGWKDQSGKLYSTTDTFTVTSDMTFTAVYEADQKIQYTVTVNAGNGKFDDGTSQKTYSGYYGDPTDIQLASPTGNTNYPYTYYEFTGWSNDIPATFTGNIIITALYETKPYEFTLTFDYAGGTCNGAASKSVQVTAGTYKVTDLIDAVPVKDSTDYDTYTFSGWNSGDTVTVNGDMTVTAQYTDNPVLYTASFHTDIGQFATGGADASYTGAYNSYQNFIDDFLSHNTADTIQPIYTNDTIYTFDKWDITAGTHSSSYKAVWKSVPRLYTVTFDADGGTFSDGSAKSQISCAYNATGDFTSVNSAQKAADSDYTYQFTGWKDQNGKLYSTADTFTVTQDMIFTAVYTACAIDKNIYTITINAGNGTFADGTTQKTYSGHYGDPTNIQLVSPTGNTNYPYTYYTFTGWSQSIPLTFTGNFSITAQYETKQYGFTVTFDAGSGTFADNKQTTVQTYHYGDTIQNTPVPTRAADDHYTYTFNGWNAALQAVTQNVTYKATWLVASKDSSLSSTGVMVTYGDTTEDINCNHIPGYQSSLVQAGDGNSYPLLEITGNGLTFSGSSSTVCIQIDDSVSDVCFKNLTLSGTYSYQKPLAVPSGSAVPAITFSGNCKIDNIDCERSVIFKGTDSTSSLTANSITLKQGAEFDTLTLTTGMISDGISDYNLYGSDTYTWTFNGSTVNINTSDDQLSWHYAVRILGGSNVTIQSGNRVGRFGGLTVTDSNLTAEGCGGIIVQSGNVMISGNSIVSLTSTWPFIAPLAIYGDGNTTGFLSYQDFTGTFTAGYQTSYGQPPVAAVWAKGIKFTVSGQENTGAYDLGGDQIAMFADEYGGENYYTFANSSGGTLHYDTLAEVKRKF